MRKNINIKVLFFLLLLVGSEAWGQDFGYVLVGTQKSIEFGVCGGGYNAQNYPISVTHNISITGNCFSVSRLSATVSGTNCMSFNVYFRPTAKQKYTGTLTIVSSNGNTSNLPLWGTGIDSTTSGSFYPSLLDFENVLPNTTATQYITITNTGTDALEISGIAKSGHAQFTLGSTAAVTLQPNITHNLAVNFKPTAYQNYTGTVTFTYSAVSSPTTISLKGTGGIPIPTTTNTIPYKQLILGDK